MTPAAVVLSLLTACGAPQQLSVAVRRCDAVQTHDGYKIIASVQNRSQKPISSIDLAVNFYRDFKTTNIRTTTHLKTELDPNATRDLSFSIHVPVQGPSMRCFATHIGFLDGTSLDVPSPR